MKARSEVLCMGSILHFETMVISVYALFNVAKNRNFQLSFIVFYQSEIQCRRYPLQEDKPRISFLRPCTSLTYRQNLAEGAKGAKGAKILILGMTVFYRFYR
jgi:hypothetical protein